MPNTPVIFALWSHLLERLVAVSNSIYEVCNRLAGRSELFDNLIALALDNTLVKAALLGGCFIAVWHGHQERSVVERNRRILVITLMASALVIATTKTLSTSIFLPRPFIESQTVFHMDGNRLVETPPLPYRVPLDAQSQKEYQRLQKGEVSQRDLGSFPSDHAGFYMTLAVGILLASRPLGWLALGWTSVVVLGSRIVTGQHSPLDIVAGSVIGVTILLALQLVFEKWFRPLMEPAIAWTFRHQAIATMLVFTAVFEAANTLQDLSPLIKITTAIAEHFLGGQR